MGITIPTSKACGEGLNQKMYVKVSLRVPKHSIIISYKYLFEKLAFLMSSSITCVGCSSGEQPGVGAAAGMAATGMPGPRGSLALQHILILCPLSQW
jgi:hypothetical protein